MCSAASRVQLTKLCVLRYSLLLADLEAFGLRGLQLVIALASHLVVFLKDTEVGLGQELTAELTWGAGGSEGGVSLHRPLSGKHPVKQLPSSSATMDESNSCRQHELPHQSNVKRAIN